jgi:C4-dicarboxylate-specific signal transduction histidine kinase
MAAEPTAADRPPPAAEEELEEAHERLREQVAQLEQRVRRAEERRRALLHIMGDLNETNRRLADQRRAMLHILVDYEADRSRLAKQTARLDGSRRALIHILQDSHESNLRLERSRKAMIHIMDDLRETTHEMERREQELREKQEQLVQAGKLATLGELTTGVAHELNNPLNNIGLFITNAIDRIELGPAEEEAIKNDLSEALAQVRKATDIISHLRMFGRAAPVTFEPVLLEEVIERSLSLMQEQLRLRQIEVELDIYSGVLVEGNPIQLEQVFINLLTNSRDALTDAPERTIRISCETRSETAVVTFADTGPGIPADLEQRIFDPFFTTKEVGTGTGLGLSITYGIIQEHGGTISVESSPGEGARFAVELPLATDVRGRENGA